MCRKSCTRRWKDRGDYNSSMCSRTHFNRPHWTGQKVAKFIECPSKQTSVLVQIFPECLTSGLVAQKISKMLFSTLESHFLNWAQPRKSICEMLFVLQQQSHTAEKLQEITLYPADSDYFRAKLRLFHQLTKFKAFVFHKLSTKLSRKLSLQRICFHCFLWGCETFLDKTTHVWERKTSKGWKTLLNLQPEICTHQRRVDAALVLPHLDVEPLEGDQVGSDAEDVEGGDGGEQTHHHRDALLQVK